MENIRDLSYGTDVRGDHALFIELKHILDDGWGLDEEAMSVVGNELTFFRIIEHGIQQHSHGWIEEGRIVQWG